MNECNIFSNVNLKEMGRRIKALRKSKGVTQVQMYDDLNYGTAEDYNIKHAVISRIENGGAVIPAKKFYAMCEYFGCSADYLRGKIDQRCYAVADICAYTGLSEKAVEVLHNLSQAKGKPGSDTEYKKLWHSIRTLSALNNVIENDSLEDPQDSSILYLLFDYFISDLEQSYFADKEKEAWQIDIAGGMDQYQRELITLALNKRIALLAEKMENNGSCKRMFEALYYDTPKGK